ncbi:MAG: class I adenylate-forming enzyme family protein [Actinomycetota bacterium]
MSRTLEDVYAELTAPGERFEVGTEVVRGTPTKVYRQAPAHLRELLDRALRHGDVPYLVYEDERWGFAETRRHAASLAHVLRDRYDVGHGDRVAIAVRNYPEWVVAFWATVALGAVSVPLNGWWQGDELEYGLSDSGSGVLVADDQRLDRLGDRLGRLGLAGRTIAVRSERDLPGVDHYGDLVDPRDDLPDADVGPDDDATIFYTSGTTGFPKGVVGTHRNMTTNLWNLLISAGARQKMGREDRATESGSDAKRPDQNAILLTVPLFHATGCHSVMVPSMFTGQKVVMMYRWDPGRALELIEREQVTAFTGVPTMVKELIEHDDFDSRDTSSLRSVGAGGAPTPPGLVSRMAELFPRANPGNGYGLTETSSISTMNGGDDYVRHPDSVGKPVPVVELRVVTDGGDDVVRGEPGELWIKGPNVVRGYWGKPDDTAESFVEGGWFRSGDVARIDDEGFVYLVDRAKDIVIRGGENISTVEVEAAIHEHDAVMEVAVFGAPHDRLGEEVAAAVLPKPGRTLTTEEIIEHLSGHLAGFKIPSRVWVVDEQLPRNAAGKIVKRDLRDRLLADDG